MKTTIEWWEHVSSSPELLNDWLLKQYFGEMQAAVRISQLTNKYELTLLQKTVIKKIATDEAMHARWVKDLLDARGVDSTHAASTNRYWDITLENQESLSFEEICAVAYHAENMRLERIVLLMKISGFDDIADVFSKIYRDEIFHKEAFKALSTPEYIEQYKASHELGRQALGLVP